ncbi:hypothetical protein F66182_2952 [Fusarium sp. NRRL 66182]|nr:hypothetical protein F66182_2952 [Fusarium sp. NRRL 66182]
MPDLVNEINGFISEHNARRGSRLTRDAFPVTPTYYAPSLMFSEGGPSTHVGSLNMSANSSSTYMSSCFDRPTVQASSVASASRQSQQPAAASPLVCEFIGFESCNAVFDWDDEAGWIAHIANYHLNNIFPGVCVCWFCDHKQFRAASPSQADAEACYRKRMHHIAKHFRDGLSWEDMRPDFFLLNHLRAHGLVREDMFQAATEYHEAPQIPDLYPAGWRPEYKRRPKLRPAGHSIGGRAGSAHHRNTILEGSCHRLAVPPKDSFRLCFFKRYNDVTQTSAIK